MAVAAEHNECIEPEKLCGKRLTSACEHNKKGPPPVAGVAVLLLPKFCELSTIIYYKVCAI